MLKVSTLVKTFATVEGTARVIDDISFEVPEGKCYALLGPSGCGKTTTLRCVAGLEHADAGRIEIGGMAVSDPAAGLFVPVHERPIGMVFQSYAIWPHLDVFENVAYPLRVRRPRVARAEIVSRTTAVLALVGMEALARRPASRLSGGQQQRVALARAIVRRPTLLLLDEPLSNLDARLRDAMRHELSEMIARIGITALYVTHDQAEAFALADRMAVMDRGRIVQEGAPRDVYARPKTPFVATFLGAANVVPGRVVSLTGNGRAVAILGGQDGLQIEIETDAAPGEALDLVLRPEDVSVSAVPPPVAGNVLEGRIAQLTFQGSRTECAVELGGGIRLRAMAGPAAALKSGASVWLHFEAGRCAAFRKPPG